MTLRDYLINAVAGAAILAAGSSIIKLEVTSAHLDERIGRIEAMDHKMDILSDHLQSVDLKLERLDGQLEGEHESHR